MPIWLTRRLWRRRTRRNGRARPGLLPWQHNWRMTFGGMTIDCISRELCATAPPGTQVLRDRSTINSRGGLVEHIPLHATCERQVNLPPPLDATPLHRLPLLRPILDISPGTGAVLAWWVFTPPTTYPTSHLPPSSHHLPYTPPPHTSTSPATTCKHLFPHYLLPAAPTYAPGTSPAPVPLPPEQFLPALPSLLHWTLTPYYGTCMVDGQPAPWKWWDPPLPHPPPPHHHTALFFCLRFTARCPTPTHLPTTRSFHPTSFPLPHTHPSQYTSHHCTF